MQQAVQRAAAAVAALRVVLGVAAVGRPDLAARPWVGRAQDSPAGVVLGRAAGARDIALGAGLLASVARGDVRATRDWTRAGVFCDLSDLGATLAAWRRLPWTRAIVSAAAGGAALVGAVAAAAAQGRAGGHRSPHSQPGRDQLDVPPPQASPRPSS